MDSFFSVDKVSMFYTDGWGDSLFYCTKIFTLELYESAISNLRNVLHYARILHMEYFTWIKLTTFYFLKI